MIIKARARQRAAARERPGLRLAQCQPERAAAPLAAALIGLRVSKANEHQLIVWFTMRVSTQQQGAWLGSYICLVAVHLCRPTCAL